MQLRVLSSFVLLVCGCTRSEEDTSISVSNIAVGLMREAADGAMHIYARGDTFPLKPNGSCDVAGKTQECMWYGVEFDYSPASARVTLACTAAYNKQTDVFDPELGEVPKSETTNYEVPLDRSDGHMAMASAVFRLPNDTPAPWTVEVACTHHGKELLRYTFTALHES